MKMPKLDELVMVEWADACSYGGWLEDDGRPFEACAVTSVGWVVQVDKDVIALSPHRQDEAVSQETMGDVMVIPLGMLKDWVELGPA